MFLIDFIEQIATYIQKYAPRYNIKVCSPIIAQSVLESASGTSELAKNAHNYFGLKYRPGRCPTACGIYYKVGSEQNKDGSYTSSAMQWMKFSNMDAGVKGYFDFINISNYSNLKGVTNPKIYLENIKKDGYATSINYVQNLMNIIDKYELTKYDKKEGNNLNYTNSSLINYTKISPNKTSPRNHIIDTITIHCLPVDETDVLTKNGWISLRNITVGEEIATCDAFRNITFDKVQNVVPVHKEKVYCFPTGFMGTLQHRLLTKKQSEVKNENIKYATTTVEEVLNRKASSYIPNSGIYQTRGLDLSPNAIDFLCAVQADGNYQYNDSKDKIYYIRLRFWKPRKIDAFRKIVKSLKYEYVEKKIYGCEGYDYGIEFIVKDPIGISICEKYLSNKIFNYKLLEMNQEQAYHFSDCLTYWDGTSKNKYTEKRYISRIKQNIDVVMAVMAIHNVGSRLNNAEMLTFKEKTYRTMGHMENVKVKNMDVSCVSVPSGYILIRQNGRPTLVGNCMAGNLSVESCGNVFAPSSRKASSNYGIGSDGRIAMYVEEKDRSWASSNAANDNRAITIEVANDGGAPDWHVSDKALNSLINLITDICKRNNIKALKWKANKSLIGQVDKQNMTVHRWFAAKACPGNYLYNMHTYIAEEVNKKLGISNVEKPNITIPSSTQSTEMYRVRKSWSDPSSQIGAYSSFENAKSACRNGYFVFDSKGTIVYPSQEIPSNNSATYQVKLLEDLNIRKTPNGTIVQVNGAKKGIIYTIVETQGTWGRLKSGAGWISISDKYVKRV